VLFVTGTRADFGKLKPLIKVTESAPNYEVHVAITGMHLLTTFGETWREVTSTLNCQTHMIANSADNESQDVTLAQTILALGNLVKSIHFDLIVVHGDRVEALGSALVGLLNNIPIAHIEGGEVSGTVDEMLRHATSKLSTYHLVANGTAHGRLIQMGENEGSIRVIGSPDIDVMASSNLPSLEKVLSHYEIRNAEYGILIFHPNVTCPAETKKDLLGVVEFLSGTRKNIVVIYPNNDPGYLEILDALNRVENENIRLLPSMRFEYFLTLLKHARLIIGNSSAGIREAPFYGTPTINIGTRQNNRSNLQQILHLVSPTGKDLEGETTRLWEVRFESSFEFGDGTSAKLFEELLMCNYFETLNIQKSFVNINN